MKAEFAESEQRCRLGQMVELTLVENPSTGYLGQIALPEGVELLESDSREASSEMIGGGDGSHCFKLKASLLGNHVVEFSLARPWEEVEPVKIHRLNLIVE